MDLLTSDQQKTSHLKKTQELLKKQGVSALLIRSTDRYFNEYVPKNMSIRYKLTGFDGSVGDAIITTDSAHLYVDGRYSLQAEKQAKGFVVHVCGNAQSIESAWLQHLSKLVARGGNLAYDPGTVDLNLCEKMSQAVQGLQAKLDPNFMPLMGDILGHELGHMNPQAHVFVPGHEFVGLMTPEKLTQIAPYLKSQGIDGLLATKLDDIAWITNLRSYYFPFQSALPGIALVLSDRIIFGAAAGLPEAQNACHKSITIVKESEFFQQIKQHLSDTMVVGIDPNETSKAHALSLHKLNIGVKPIKNPLPVLKALKNEKELLHLRSAFKKADHAVYQTQNFVVSCFEKGNPLTESDVDDYIKNAFKESGAEELSFRPICASAEHGAIIHYGHPSGEKILAKNSLFLLDTGAYYEAGYATDLTRTFLAGKKSDGASPWQKTMFTLVLKASIRGLCARLRRGSTGMQLDAIVRSPLWQAGLDFAHGTGHGVGINVHEFPPRIGPTSTTELMEGQVFSIEPGLYFAGLGGVRIENLATIVSDPEHEQFMRVLPLTFCPFDDRLIQHDMLDQQEQNFLLYYKREWTNEAPWPELPPLETVRFAY
jgi:Xaa-Pro aminopeptidase